MKANNPLSNSTCAEQLHLAQRELAAFIHAVSQRFGAEQARISAEDWLEQSELMVNLPRSTSRDWRAVTVAASVRLANRVTVVRPHQTPLAAVSVVDGIGMGTAAPSFS